MNYSEQADALARHLQMMPFRDRLAEISPAAVDAELESKILDEAAKFAATEMEPVAAALDREGARVVDGRVRLPSDFSDLWKSYREMGWMAMSAEEPDGQGLSLSLTSACEEMFNRASIGFCMLPTAGRTASSLLRKVAPTDLADEWVPRLLSGEWAATICISEPDAGSDVGRIRTVAHQQDEGWLVTGEKCWMSFGDHDAAPRICYLALARSNQSVGARGLSLFLIPSVHDDGRRNNAYVRRIEEKLGLHCSPTCQIGFEGAQGMLLGEEGRGLQTLFHMMLLMRLTCGPMGTGLASAAFATALGYAQDRKQGGPADAPAVAISQHADIQRILMEMASSIELYRGLTLATATTLDLAARCPDQEEARYWQDLAQFLLPLVKDGTAWCAVECAGKAVQVLGGAGFTCEWPVERYVRDSKVFPIFEGTTGIQALDLLHRRVWRDNRVGLNTFIECLASERSASAALDEAVILLQKTAERLAAMSGNPRQAEAGAVAFLDLCKMIALGWIAVRLKQKAGDDPIGRRMSGAADFFLAELPARSRFYAEMACAGDDRLAGFAAWAG